MLPVAQSKESPSGPLHWELPQRPRGGAIGKHCKSKASLEGGSNGVGGGSSLRFPLRLKADGCGQSGEANPSIQ